MRLEKTLAEGDELVIPVIAERLEIERVPKETTRVRVAKRVEQEIALVEELVASELVDVKRVPVGQYVDGPVAARQEGDTTVVPVLKEVLVVEKRLLLVEEIHITRLRSETIERQDVPLRREVIEVVREAIGSE